MSFASARGIWLASATFLILPSSPSFSQPAANLPPVVVTQQPTPQRAIQRSKRGGTVRTVQPATAAPSTQPAPPVPGSLTVPTAQQALGRNPANAWRRRDRPRRGLQELDARSDAQGRARLRAGRVRAAEMGRGLPPVDPRFRPVAQLSSARRPALHGRHPDQHRRRLRRFSGDSTRPPIAMSRSTRARTPCAMARPRSAVRSISSRRRAAMRHWPRSASTSARSVSPARRRRRPASRAPGTASSPHRRQRADGFRDHSDGHAFRGSGNIGYQITPDIETRFYFNGNSVRQRIPGSVTKSSALNTPQTAAVNNVLQRPAAQHRHAALRQQDHGTLRQYDRRGRRIRRRPAPDASDLPVAGLSVRRLRRVRTGHRRPPHRRLAQPLRRRRQCPQRADRQPAVRRISAASRARCCRRRSTSRRIPSAYVEDSLFVLPNVAVIAGTQFIHATRNRQDRFLSNGNQSGATEFNLWSPRAGLLWDIDPTWQAFANVSRSAEIPSFGENSFATVALSSVRPQRATTYEIGTRGRRPNLTWELALYRADITNEFLCLTNPNTLGTLQRRQRGQNVPSRDRSGPGCFPVRFDFCSRSRRRSALAERRLHVQRLPLPERSASTATTSFPARRRTTCGRNCFTGIRQASLPDRMSSGCPFPTMSTAPTAFERSPMRCWGRRSGTTTENGSPPTSKAET